MKLKNKLSYALYFLLVIVFFNTIFSCNNREKEKKPKTTNVEWIETKIVVNFSNGNTDTYVLDIYESIDKIEVENGNLTYWKSSKKSGGVVAKKILLASNVNNYKVIYQNEKQKVVE